MSKKEVNVLFINFLLILIFFVIYAVILKITSIALVAAKYSESSIFDSSMLINVDAYTSKIMFVQLSLYAILQAFGLIAYLKKNKLMLKILLGITVVFALYEIITCSPEYIIFLAPAISTLLYLYGIKGEKEVIEEKEKHHQKKQINNKKRNTK